MDRRFMAAMLTNRYWLAFVTSFGTSAGGAYLTSTSAGMPTTTGAIVSIVAASLVTGIVAGLQAVQKLTETPPPSS